MSAPHYAHTEPTPEWHSHKKRRRKKRYNSATDARPKRRGRLLLAYLLFLWILEPEGIGRLITDTAETVVNGFADAVVVASGDVKDATDNVMSLQLMLDKFGLK